MDYSRLPKRIEVMPCAVKLQLLGDCELDLDMFDAVIRRLKEVDQKVYRDQGTLQWRHFVESEFMVRINSCFFIY